MERFCIYRYEQSSKTKPTLIKSNTHKRKSPPIFKRISFHRFVSNNLIVSHRTTSTNCNPFNTSTDCDCTGIINADPSNKITNFPMQPSVEECVSVQGNRILSGYDNTFTNIQSSTECISRAYDIYNGNAQSEYDIATQTCKIADDVPKIMPAKKTNTSSIVYTCKNNADGLMRYINDF